MEARLNVATGGYNKRASSLLAGINDALNALDETRLELGCFRRLKGIEDQAVGRRLAKLQAEVRPSSGVAWIESSRLKAKSKWA